MVEQDNAHRLHSYLADIKRKQKVDREVAEEAEYELREVIEDDLGPKLREPITRQLDKQIEKRLRAELEAKYHKPKGLFGKILGD